MINETVQALSADSLVSETDEIVAELDDVEVWAVAREIADRGLSTLPVEQVAEILTLADQSWTPMGIGNEVGLPAPWSPESSTPPARSAAPTPSADR